MAQEMKDSGIEWIGKIPISWRISKNKYLLSSMYSGSTPTASDPTFYSDTDGIPFVAISDMSTTEYVTVTKKHLSNEGIANKNLQIVPSGTILYSIYATVGAVSELKISATISQAMLALFLKKSINKQYYKYCLLSMKDYIYCSANGNTQFNLNAEKVWNFILPLPSISEQHRIATFLDHKCAEIDSVIADTQKTIEEYKALKQSIITEAVTRGVRGERKMKDSGIEWIGDVPEEWEVIPVKYVAEFQPSCDMSNLTDDSIITYLPMEHLKNGYYIQNTAFYGSVASSLTPFMNGDIVMAKVTPCFENGNIAIMNDLSSGVGMGSSELFVYRPLDVQTKYLLYWLQNFLFKQAACATMTGTGGLKRVSPYFAKHSKMTLPCYKEQLEIIRYLDEKCTSLDKLIESKQQLLTELESYKKSVIYEYVTGKKECGIAVAQVTQAAIVPFYPAAISTKRVRFAQAVLMAKVLDKCHKGMGRVKLEKTMYTIETIIGFDFETEYVRQVAGPLDESLYKCEGIISRVNHWYTVCASQHGVSYKPTKNADKYQSYYCRYFGNYNTEIERIIDIFASYTTEQAEVIATLLAAWNDAIIEGKSFTDTDIVNDVLNNWSEEKKRFSKDVWLRAMDELRKKDLIPKGYGKKTVRRNIK